MSRQYVIAVVALLALVVIAGPARSETSLEKKLDSLFVIASSGEVMYRDMVDPAIDSIAAVGADAAPFLIDQFSTKSARERWTIIKVFRKIGTPAVPYLVRALKRPDGLIVQRVCGALAEVGDSTAVAPLVAVADHSRWQVRDQAVGALGKIGDTIATATVVSALSDPIGQVRKAAAVACGRLGATVAAERLVYRLGDDFYGARWTAFEALLKLDTALVVGVVSDSLASANPMLGDMGCRLLARIGDDDALDHLFGQMSSSSPERRAVAAVGIIEADPHDECGYRKALFDNETDRLVLLKMKSAIASLPDVRQ